MIASLHGRITANSHGYLVVVVNGVGYRVYVPMPLQGFTIGEEITLHTSLVVREDSMTLYGFRAQQDVTLFEILLSISGVGPKVALSILSTLSADNLRNAVTSERAEILTRVPGIGKKTAQKILFELKDKLKIGLDAVPVAPMDDVDTDVVDSLVALGYSIVEAQTAVQSISPDTPNDVEERLRVALQYFT
ncbi:MAG: Holliday junction branch migration protein RuvA [Chloroflexota bacterium]